MQYRTAGITHLSWALTRSCTLASALCGNSSNPLTKILANTYLLQPGNLDGDLSNRLLQIAVVVGGQLRV